MSEVYRGENGEIIEVRYLDIPDRPTAPNGLPLVDEIVCGPMHLETLDDNALYLRVAGLMVNVWAHGGRKAQLSVTVEPDGCELVSGEEGVRSASDDKRPYISIDPAMKFGLPTLNHTRLPAESVADCVWEGWDLAKLQTDGWPELRRSDVLVCCWFVGKHGTRTWRKRWGAWAKAVQPQLWSASTVDYEVVSWPPTWQTEQGEGQ